MSDPAPSWLRELVGYVPIDGSAEGVGLVFPPVGDPAGTHPTFAHWCLASRRWVLSQTTNHTVVTRPPVGPWHLEASLLCPDCQLHGWIRGGLWVAA